MLTDSNLRSAVDSLWDKLWSGGLSNPLDAIEQLSFLLFLKRLDENEQDNERAAKRRGAKFTPTFPRKELRWSHWTQLPADKALKAVKEEVFPFIKTLGGAGGSFAQQMENAEFKINKPSLLIEACKAIDALQISAQNQDVQGDLYEYLLSKLNTAGTNGQFRTPRHIIRMMVKMVDPHPGERISAEEYSRFIRKCEPRERDILVVSRGATIGRTCVVNTAKPFCLMGSVILIKPDATLVNPHFLSAQLKSASFLRVLKTTSGASAQQAIYIAHLKEKKVVLPPMKLQKKFATLVERYIRLRTSQREVFRQADHIFQSLLHSAFSCNA